MRWLFTLAALFAVPPGTGPVAGTAWHPSTLPAGRVDSVYAQTVTPTPPHGAKATSVVCVCTAGHRLPPGLTGNKLGTAFGITGVPEKVGIYRFELRVGWSEHGRAFWGKREYSIFVGVAKNQPSDVGMRVGVRVTRSGDTVTALVVNGGKTDVRDFTVFPIDLQVQKVLSATGGLKCARKSLGKDSLVACSGGPHPGKRVTVRFTVRGAKSKLAVIEATGQGVSTSIATAVEQP